MCEITRNSVLQSGWEMQIKKRWLGDKCDLTGPDGNNISKTNIPNIRLLYRYETLMEERLMVLNSLRTQQMSSQCDLGEDIGDLAVDSLSLANPTLTLEPLISGSPLLFPNSMMNPSFLFENMTLDDAENIEGFRASPNLSSCRYNDYGDIFE